MSVISGVANQVAVRFVRPVIRRLEVVVHSIAMVSLGLIAAIKNLPELLKGWWNTRAFERSLKEWNDQQIRQERIGLENQQANRDVAIRNIRACFAQRSTRLVLPYLRSHPIEAMRLIAPQLRELTIDCERMPYWIDSCNSLTTLSCHVRSEQCFPWRCVNSLRSLEVSGPRINQFFIWGWDAGRFHRLERLVIRGTGLDGEFPSFRFPVLRSLELIGNRFSSLPTVGPSFSRDCRVFLNEPHLNPNFVRAFHRNRNFFPDDVRGVPPFLQDHRVPAVDHRVPAVVRDEERVIVGNDIAPRRGIDYILNDRLPFYRGLGFPVDMTQDLSRYLQTLTANQIHAFGRFLERLPEMAAWRIQQREIVRNLGEVIGAMIRDQGFSQTVLGNMDEVISTCGDRVAYYWSAICTNFSLQNAATSVDRARVIIGIERKNRIALRMQELGGHDPIEDMLYGWQQLATRLHLPNIPQRMLYHPSLQAEQSVQEIGDAILAATSSQEQMMQILMSEKLWRDHLEQRYQTEIDQCKTRFDDEHEIPDDVTQAARVLQQREEAIVTEMQRLTTNFLERNRIY